jgi:hypothetical protein
MSVAPSGIIAAALVVEMDFFIGALISVDVIINILQKNAAAELSYLKSAVIGIVDSLFDDTPSTR